MPKKKSRSRAHGKKVMASKRRHLLQRRADQDSRQRTEKGQVAATRLQRVPRRQSSRGSPAPRRQPSPRPLTKNQRTEIRTALELVRKHIKGYGPREFSLRLVDEGKISRTRVGTLLRKWRTLRGMLKSPHDLIKAPNKRARRELYKFTHQKIRGAKHFIVHKPADNFSVRISRRGRISIRGRFAGKVHGHRRSQVVTESQFFLFDHVAVDEDDAVDMLRDMLPNMPEGFYVLLTGMHGDTGEPMERGKIEARLRDYIARYKEDSVAVYDRSGAFIGRKEVDTGFVQAITGFRHLSTRVDGMELQMQARDIRRERGEAYNRRLQREQSTAYERTRQSLTDAAEKTRLRRKVAAKKAARTRARRKK